MSSDDAADIRLDAVLGNCIFYISPMYEFLHSLDPNVSDNCRGRSPGSYNSVSAPDPLTCIIAHSEFVDLLATLRSLIMLAWLLSFAS